MKRLTKIFQALIGMCAVICTMVLAFGRLTWQKIRKFWKRCPKYARDSIVFGLILSAVIGYCYNKYYNCIFPYYKQPLTWRCEAHYFQNSKLRVYDTEKERYITSKFDWYQTFEEYGDSVAVYAKDEKRGYFNIYTGEIVVDLEENDYSRAWKFSEGKAAVVKDGKVGFINAENEVVIPFVFDYYSSYWGSFDYVFHEGNCQMTDSVGNLGLIDVEGNWLLDPEYDDIWNPQEAGYRVIIKDGKYGVVDARGKIVYPAEYVYARLLDDGIELIKGGRNWKVDFEGNVIRPFLFSSIRYFDGNDDYAAYQVWDYYGILNLKTGQPVTLAIYSEVYFVNDKYFRVQDPSNYEFYLIDTRGKMVVE